MPRSQGKLGEVFRRYGPAYRTAHAGRLSRNQRRVMHAIDTNGVCEDTPLSEDQS